MVVKITIEPVTLGALTPTAGLSRPNGRLIDCGSFCCRLTNFLPYFHQNLIF